MKLAAPILVTGASGQVGGALGKLLGSKAVLVDRSEMDLTSPEQIERVLNRVSPSAVINPGAYTQVDKAEQEETLATQINALAPEIMARWCAGRGIPFVHYSTDYVFAGDGTRPWIESDLTGPLGAYGRSELEGEKRIAEVGGRWMIFRTSWVYDATGANFLNTMLRLGRDRELLRVVGDQHGAPTFEAICRRNASGFRKGAEPSRLPQWHLSSLQSR